MTENSFPVTQRTQAKRRSKRVTLDRTTIYEILDAMPLCHIGYIREGHPAVMPTLQWRKGDHVYWHGAPASYTLKASDEQEVCLSVTLLDGFVMARSAFHHSMNFRSAILYGKAKTIEDYDLKAEKLKDMMDAFFPGRWDELRPIKEKEVNATRVMSMQIDEASAKIRTGMPVDDEADYDLPIWAGVIPLKTITLQPQDDPRNQDNVTIPGHLKEFNFAVSDKS